MRRSDWGVVASRLKAWNADSEKNSELWGGCSNVLAGGMEYPTGAPMGEVESLAVTCLFIYRGGRRPWHRQVEEPPSWRTPDISLLPRSGTPLRLHWRLP